MAFSGGTFSRTFDCTTDRDNGVKILASKFDTELDGFATGLSTCILKDGTQTCTAAIPFAEGLTVPDNKTIVLGTNSDITIQYDESTNDSLEIAANVEGAALGIVLKADQGDDNADQHKLNIADGGVLTLGSKISGSFVSYLTHTPNSTVASSTTAVAGNLTVGGDLTLGSGAVISEAELEAIDGVTAGTVTASKAVIVDSNKDIASFRNITTTGTVTGGSVVADNITIDGNTISSTDTNGNINITPNGTGAVAFTTNATFGDNDKAIFGAGTDMSIYHDGSNSYIDDSGTGSLNFRGSQVNIGKYTGEDMVTAVADGAVTLFHDNSAKIATSQDGVDVLGIVTADGLTVDTNTLFVDASNNRVGIGTDAPAHNVEIVATAAGSVNDSLQIRNNATSNGTGSRIRFINSTDANSDANGASIASVRNGNDNDLVFETENSEAMRIGHSGNVGINEASPAAPLHISTGASTTAELRLTSNNTGSGSGDRGRIAVYSSRNDGTAYEAGRIEIDRSSGTEDKAHILFATNNGSGVAERLKIDSSGNVGIGTSSPSYLTELSGNGSGDTVTLALTNSGSHPARVRLNSGHGNWSVGNSISVADALEFRDESASSTRALIDSSGFVMVNTTSAKGQFTVDRSGAEVGAFNRLTNDGSVVGIYQDNTLEGNISVSGTTVSYNGGHLARWSQLADNTKDTSIVKGTVMTNLDQMAVWHHEAQPATYYEEGDELPEGVSVGDEKTPAVAAYDEDNEQLNCMAVSSVEGDANVAGVFVNWDDDDDFNDMNVAMTGDMVIRIASGTTVARGDLLMSAGDGTAKPQDDDIVRSKTIAKVTSTIVSHTYDDGSYLVPCVLMAC